MVEEFDEDAAHFEVENNGAKFPADLIFPRLQHQIAGTAVNQIVDEVLRFPHAIAQGVEVVNRVKGLLGFKIVIDLALHHQVCVSGGGLGDGTIMRDAIAVMCFWCCVEADIRGLAVKFVTAHDGMGNLYDGFGIFKGVAHFVNCGDPFIIAPPTNSYASEQR